MLGLGHSGELSADPGPQDSPRLLQTAAEAAALPGGCSVPGSRRRGSAARSAFAAVPFSPGAVSKAQQPALARSSTCLQSATPCMGSFPHTAALPVPPHALAPVREPGALTHHGMVWSPYVEAKQDTPCPVVPFTKATSPIPGPFESGAPTAQKEPDRPTDLLVLVRGQQGAKPSGVGGGTEDCSPFPSRAEVESVLSLVSRTWHKAWSKGSGVASAGVSAPAPKGRALQGGEPTNSCRTAWGCSQHCILTCREQTASWDKSFPL